MVGTYLHRRDGIWHFRRRVPSDLADLDPRGAVRISTKKRDYQQAVVVASRINAELEALWGSLSASPPDSSSEAVARFERAAKLARSLGLSYRPVSDLAAGDVGEIVRRIDVLESRNLVRSPAAREAVLGGAPVPALLMSQLYDTYAAHVRDELAGKSEDQKRKWRNTRVRAIRHFIEVVGDKALCEVTRNDVLDLREWWVDRVVDEDYDPRSANKDIGFVATMFRVVNRALRLGLDPPFGDMRIKSDGYTPRTPFDPQFVRERILPDKELTSLNDEARGIVLMVATTGMRPSEIAALTPRRIHLTANIPYVAIEPEDRQLKTRHARRRMPLVGVALETMRRFPDGFPRYRDTPDTFSATANKALGAAGLRPTPGHTVYSLRHTFKDRLIAIEAPERVQDALMGHKVREMEYGAGPSLEQCATWISRVWD